MTIEGEGVTVVTAPRRTTSGVPLDVPSAVETDAKAQKTIQTNVLISMGIGLVPLPMLDVAALLGQQLYMLKSLGDLYGQHLTEDIGKKGVLTLITAMAPQSTLWKFGIGSLLKSIPLVGQTLAVLTSPIIAGATTYALGQVFNLHFASGGTFLSFDPVKHKRHFQEMFTAGLSVAQTEQSGTTSVSTTGVNAN